MDDSYPIILTNGNESKNGTLKELTIEELTRETSRIFRQECELNDVEYWADGNNKLQIEDDDDLEAEFQDINHSDNDDDDEDENEDSDDDNEEEEKDLEPIRLRLKFIKKEIKIHVPKPIKIGINNIRSTTVMFDWILDKNELNKNQLSSLSFEIIDDNNINSFVAKCNPITDNKNERYEIKVTGLHPKTNYKFNIRSILTYENKDLYSELCDIINFQTKPNIESNNIPHEIEGPTDLQVIALYSDSVILSWNHSNPNLLSKYDYEYYIYEQDVFGGEIIAATEDNHFITIKSLSPLTQYTFICKSKYYDPERLLSDFYYLNQQIISTSTNSVTIVTPEKQKNIYEYKTKKINKVRWKWIEKNNQLELFWVAPESFYGKIEYQIIDKIQKKIIGNCCKLPVVITTGDKNKSIFGTQYGKYIITIKPILINDSDEKEQTIECESYDIEITIDDEKKEYSSESILEFGITYIGVLDQWGKDMKRTIRIATANCDYNKFKKEILRQFKINNGDNLKIYVQINNENIDINNNNSWQSFINNHSQKYLMQQRKVYCFIQTVMDIPQQISIRIDSKQSQFAIDFKSEKAGKYYCQIEAKKNLQNMANVDLGMEYNQIVSTSKPIIYNVQSQHQYYYFRFKIKCNYNGSFSQWTKWKTLISQNQSPLQNRKSPSQNQKSPLQNQKSPLQSSLQTSPLQTSPLQTSPLQQQSSQFDFPGHQSQSLEHLGDKTKANNSGSLEELTATYSGANDSDFWKNF